MTKRFDFRFPPGQIAFMKLAMIVAGLAAALVASAAETASDHDGWIDFNKNGKMDIYENPALPVSERVYDLLERMTLDEKIGQLWQASFDLDPDKVYAGRIARGEVSSFLDSSALIETPVMRNKLQHLAVEQSRLGIPLIFGHDSIHGFRTVFPIPLAQACAWEPELFERTQTISARESTAGGIDWAFALLCRIWRVISPPGPHCRGF